MNECVCVCNYNVHVCIIIMWVGGCGMSECCCMSVLLTYDFVLVDLQNYKVIISCSTV